MLIDILLSSLSVFTSSCNAPRSVLQAPLRIRLVHAKASAATRLRSDGQTGS
jgi:hypothetical protein